MSTGGALPVQATCVSVTSPFPSGLTANMDGSSKPLQEEGKLSQLRIPGRGTLQRTLSVPDAPNLCSGLRVISNSSVRARAHNLIPSIHIDNKRGRVRLISVSRTLPSNLARLLFQRDNILGIVAVAADYQQIFIGGRRPSRTVAVIVWQPRAPDNRPRGPEASCAIRTEVDIDVVAIQYRLGEA